MTNAALASFLVAGLLACADLAILAWATHKLGSNASSKEMAGLGLAVVAKFAVLALGLAWMSKQTWFHKPASVAGVLAPFVLFVLWQALRLQLKKRP